MIQITYGEFLIGLGLLGGIIGVVYQVGRLAARVESLEAWRAQLNQSIEAINLSIRHIELALTNRPARRTDEQP